MNYREAITRAQVALHEQDAEANRDTIAYFDRLAAGLGHVENIKLYADRVSAVVLDDKDAS